MRLIVPIVLNCILVAAIYLVDKYTPAKRMPRMVKQTVIGVLFGGLSAFASSYGVALLGTNVNVRDAAPLTAGLVFGAPAGIISGVIGGTYRWFSVYWGAGLQTQLACTIATILAGVMAAGLRKLMFDDKKPTWGYGIAITVVCEVIHMLLIFLTNMGDSVMAFGFVRGATIPMIIGNSLAVGASIVIISIFSHERLTHKRANEQIAHTFQRWLLVCIVFAFMATSIFAYFLQDGMAKIETEEVFTTAIADVKKDVRGKSDVYMLGVVEKIAKSYVADPLVPLETLAVKNHVMEINIVDSEGNITDSTNPEYIGSFNMNSTEQSKEFMVLVNGETEFVQEYGPIGIDQTVMRKYAGRSLSDGRFIQVGYNTDQFHKMLNGFVIDVTKNRHVGHGGFVAVCDEEMRLVTEDSYNGKHISAIGIEPDARMDQGLSAVELTKADITNGIDGESLEHIYVYTFVEGYCIIAAMPYDEAMFMRDASIYNSVFMQVLIFATLFVFIYILIKRVIINNLKKINNSLAQITEGNLNVKVDVRTNQEFASLSDDINSTVSTLKRYISEAAARIDKELEYAKQIQLSALPTDFPVDEDYSISAQMIAAKEVGGDFYDFYKLNDKTVAFLCADVSGKGIPAAMFMMTAKTIIKDLAERGLCVDEIFTQANEKLCENNESGMFVTAWMGILDTESGKLQYANAGHNPPMLFREGKGFEYLRSKAGFVLAGMEGIRYRVNELTLSEGDRLFLYTDGVTEATDLNDKLYGEQRLSDYLNKNSTAAPEDIPMGLKADIDSFVGSAPQFDDITMLIFDYKRKKGAVNMTERIFPAKTEALTELLAFTEEQLELIDCPPKTVIAISVALEEVFVNVAHYAYGDGEGDVRLSFSYDKESSAVTFIMADRGVPFDPLKKPDPDITLSAEDREIGGLGIFITKKTMDSVSYSYENGENLLTMIKKI